MVSQDESIEPGELLASIPILLGLISLPSLAPIWVARRTSTRWAAAVLMAAAAAAAGVAATASDDAQAGLAVLLVMYAVVPVCLAVASADWVVGRMRPAKSPGA
jgi:type III secretory pathway component EscR